MSGMAVLGRLIVAMLIASCTTAILLVMWNGFLFSVHPHWMLQILFMLFAIAFHFFIVYQAYLFVKRKWF
jgi:hypothetical protein